LDLPQAVVELDRDDPQLVRDVRRARRDPGERGAYAMIEEFMLAANEAVGESFQQRNELVVWRVHDRPDQDKLETFAAMAERYGIRVDLDEARTPLGLAAALKRLHGHPAEKALSFQLLRSLKQATYEIDNVGHFGLASTAYLHFTSPIRRYPDVIAHRLLKRRLASLGKPAGGFAPLDRGTPPSVDSVRQAATDASFSERKAMEVERGVVDLYRAFFMRDRVGDVLEGTISGVASFGIFVVIDEPFVEGLVRSEYLQPDDFYQFDDVAMRMVGRRHAQVFALGDRVTVEVLSVSVARRQIDLRVHDHTRATREPPRTRRRAQRTAKETTRTEERKHRRERVKARNAAQKGKPRPSKGPKRPSRKRS
jgi:ribonuclease R